MSEAGIYCFQSTFPQTVLSVKADMWDGSGLLMKNCKENPYRVCWPIVSKLGSNKWETQCYVFNNSTIWLPPPCKIPKEADRDAAVFICGLKVSSLMSNLGYSGTYSVPGRKMDQYMGKINNVRVSLLTTKLCMLETASPTVPTKNPFTGDSQTIWKTWLPLPSTDFLCVPVSVISFYSYTTSQQWSKIFQPVPQWSVQTLRFAV